MMMKRTLALFVGLVLATLGGLQPAQAGKTDLLKEFVGNIENVNRIGEGNPGEAPGCAVCDSRGCENVPCFPGNEGLLESGRFAGSRNTISEGPPPGASDPDTCSGTSGSGCVDDFTGGESFSCAGGCNVLPSSVRSPNNRPVFETTPTCRGDFGVSHGNQAIFTWEIALEETPIVGSEIQLQLCLDVRKCQRDDDGKGQASTPGEIALTVHNDLVGAAVIKVVHEAGNFRLDRPFGSSRLVTDLIMPGLDEVTYPNTSRIPDIPRTADPERPPYEAMLEESIEFIGKDCAVKWIKNDGMFVKHDRIRVELSIPSSINVRVRASQDSAAVCYLALVGE